MSSKVLVIIASGDKAVIHTALMYARNALKNKWLEDVNIILFGPSEQLIAKDSELAQEVEGLCLDGDTIACKFISDKEGISKPLSKLGVKIEYVGTIISNYIKNGYVPMVW